MNLKRPLFFIFLFQILGIILSNDFNFTTKAILICIAFVFVLKNAIIGKLRFIGIFILIFTTIVSFIRFDIDKKYYDNINNKIEDAEDFIVGEIIEYGKTTNSTYANVKTNNYGTVKIYGINNIRIGNIIKIYGNINKNSTRQNRGQFDFEKYYRSVGISSNMYAKKFEVIDRKYNIVVDKIYKIKNIINENIDKIFDEKDSGIVKAIISGDKSDLDEDIKSLFTQSGIAHILAISGLHLSILGLMLFNGLRLKLDIHKSSIIVSIFIICYAIFINATATSVRAIVMLLVRFLSLSCKRSYDSKNTLSIIGIIQLFIHPYLIFNIGFLFSYTAIFALNIYETKLGYRKIKIPEYIVVSLFLMPITIYAYYTYPTYSIILNLIVIPLMTFVLIFILISIFFATFCLPLALMFSNAVHFLLKFYELLCKFNIALPYSKLVLGQISETSILVFYITLILFIKFLYNKKIILSAVFLPLFLLSFSLLHYIKNYNYLISFLSVGQGDCIVIQNEKETITIDGGSTSNKNNGKYILEPFLLSQQIQIIDKAFITHPDNDHTNGIKYLLSNSNNIKIKKIYLPYFAKDNKKYDEIKELCLSANTDIEYIDNNFIYKNIECIYPFKDMECPKDANDHSLVLKINFTNDNYGEKNIDFLFAGDISSKVEKKIIESKANIDVDVLKVAHHGSKNSSSEEFIKELSPKYSVISYGKNNYGHPSKRVVDDLNKYGCNKIFETYKNGEIDYCITSNNTIGISIIPDFSEHIEPGWYTIVN